MFKILVFVRFKHWGSETGASKIEVFHDYFYGFLQENGCRLIFLLYRAKQRFCLLYWKTSELFLSDVVNTFVSTLNFHPQHVIVKKLKIEYAKFPSHFEVEWIDRETKSLLARVDDKMSIQ